MPVRGDNANVLLQVSFRLVVSPFGLNRSGRLLLLKGSRRPVVEIGNRFAVTRFYVLAEQFPAGMSLPAVGRITPGQTRLQNRPRSGTSAIRTFALDSSHPLPHS